MIYRLEILIPEFYKRNPLMFYRVDVIKRNVGNYTRLGIYNVKTCSEKILRIFCIDLIFKEHQKRISSTIKKIDGDKDFNYEIILNTLTETFQYMVYIEPINYQEIQMTPYLTNGDETIREIAKEAYNDLHN